MAGPPYSTNSSPPHPPPPPPPTGLIKHRSWSPDSEREETWLRRKGLHRRRRGAASAAGAGSGLTRLRRSVTDEDLDELRACIDLGFGFDLDFAAPDDGGGSRQDDPGRRRLSETFPALDLYYAVHRSYRESIAGSLPCTPRTSASFDDDSCSPADSPVSFFSPGDSPEEKKARLKQWAQVVACSVRQRC